jgi:hypothetical protein
VPEPADSSPDYFVNLGSVALFGADDGITGRELWRSDAARKSLSSSPDAAAKANVENFIKQLESAK